LVNEIPASTGSPIFNDHVSVELVAGAPLASTARLAA
jgi:hypothetical protein